MQLTYSYQNALPQSILDRYEILEVRNAAKVMRATASSALDEVMQVLDGFRFGAGNLLLAGKNESQSAREFNAAIRQLGWRESRVDTVIQNTLVRFPYPPIDGKGAKTVHVASEPDPYTGYKADWMKDRIAGDFEWNAKDGNLDRNFASYRSLYETGFIDGAILVSRTQEDLRVLERQLINEMLAIGADASAAVTGHDPAEYRAAINRIQDMRAKSGGVETPNELRLGTSTTTNLEKLVHRVRRGDGGGCPILVIGICARTFDGVHLTGGTVQSAAVAGHNRLVTTEEDHIPLIDVEGGEK